MAAVAKRCQGSQNRGGGIRTRDLLVPKSCSRNAETRVMRVFALPPPHAALVNDPKRALCATNVAEKVAERVTRQSAGWRGPRAHLDPSGQVPRVPSRPWLGARGLMRLRLQRLVHLCI